MESGARGSCLDVTIPNNRILSLVAILSRDMGRKNIIYGLSCPFERDMQPQFHAYHLLVKLWIVFL